MFFYVFFNLQINVFNIYDLDQVANLRFSGQLSLLPFTGREMSSSLRAMGWRPSVADWSGGMSVCCTVVQLFVNAGNGWPRDAPRYHWLLPVSCKSTSGHESDSCKQRYSKYPTFTFNSVKISRVKQKSSVCSSCFYLWGQSFSCSSSTNCQEKAFSEIVAYWKL